MRAFPAPQRDNSLVREPADKHLQPDMDGIIEPLSKRELEVIKLIAEGLSNKEVAQKMHITVRTVKYYTTGIYTKLGVRGRAQAAVKAQDLGLLN